MPSPFAQRIDRLIRAGSTTVLALVVVLASGCALFDKKDSDKDEYANWSADQLMQEAKLALTEKNYDKAIKLYEKLEARYPFGPQATQAQVDVAFAYYKNGEPDSAIAAADRFIKVNQTHPNVDYAYYLRGLVNYNRGISFLDRFLPTDSSQRDPGAARDALRDFNELIGKFPHSKYVDDSRQRIGALRNNLAMYEVHVADFYMRRGGYLAAARRCSEVLEKYQRTGRAQGLGDHGAGLSQTGHERIGRRCRPGLRPQLRRRA